MILIPNALFCLLLPPKLAFAFAFDYNTVTYGLMGSFLGSLALALVMAIPPTAAAPGPRRPAARRPCTS